MPNRDLKDTNRRSVSLQLISDAAERLWYRLITAVDDFGRLEADPEVVFTSCFQRVPKGWTIKKVEACLHELATVYPPGEAPLLQMYTVGVRRYLQIVSAQMHIYRRAKESKYPAPPIAPPQLLASAPICPQMPADSLELRTPNSESRASNSESRTSVADATARFDEFWRVFPDRDGKKLEKAAAKDLFEKLSAEDQSLAIRATGHYSTSLQRQGISAKDPKRFLRDGKGLEPWRDWIDPACPRPSVTPPQGKCAWVNGGGCEAYAVAGSRYCLSHRDGLLVIQERFKKDAAEIRAPEVPAGTVASLVERIGQAL